MSENRIPLIHVLSGRTTLTTETKWKNGSGAFIANGFRQMTEEEIAEHYEEVPGGFNVVTAIETSGEVKETDIEIPPPIDENTLQTIPEDYKEKKSKKRSRPE